MYVYMYVYMCGQCLRYGFLASRRCRTHQPTLSKLVQLTHTLKTALRGGAAWADGLFVKTGGQEECQQRKTWPSPSWHKDTFAGRGMSSWSGGGPETKGFGWIHLAHGKINQIRIQSEKITKA